MKKLFLLLALLSFVFTACDSGLDNEENGGTPSTPKIELSQQSVEVEFESAEYEVTITSPYSWEATAKNDWIKVISENGIAGTKELKFSVERNEELEIREGTIVVKNEDYNLIAELYITQKAFVPAITIEPESLAFAVEGGTQEIAITANFEYTYSSNADWLTIKKSEKGISVTVPNYVEAEERTAEITISNEKYGISKVVKATQRAFVPAITIEPETLTFAVEGGTQEIAITANFEYEYSTNADWLTIEKSENGISVTVPNYVEVEERTRTAEITISNEKYGISKVVKVAQGAFVPAITIEPESLTFAVEGGTQEVAITTNFEYEYSTNVDWLTIEKSENGVKVTATLNTKFEERTAEITISSEKYGISKAITIMQQGVSAEAQNVILYTSSNGEIVTPNKSNVFGANIVSNIYKDGQGIIIFDAPVTSIGEDAFYYCSSLTSVTIGNSVTSIGSYAFYYCSSLTSVTIGNSVTSIGERAFLGCTSLTSVTIPDSVTSIGYGAFADCSSLTSVTIPDSVTSIGYAAFSSCSSLKAFYGKFASSDNRALIVDNCIIAYACDSGTTYTIPDSVTSIGEYAFYYCRSLTSVTIPDSVTSIGNYAFYYCRSLTSVTIPDSVTEIGYEAFYYCRSLTSVTIPDSVTSIGNYAFSNCTSLTSITIPDSVTEIGGRAFCGCTGELVINSKKLVETNYTYSNYPTNSSNGWLCDSEFTKLTIGNSVTSIGDLAFEGCTSLTSITIPDSVTSIGNYAFYECSRLTRVTIPDSVTSIGYSAFYFCSSLTAFYGKFASADNRCLIIDGVLHSFAPAGLIQYTIPDSVTSIGDSAFSYCWSLTSVTIGNSVTSIGDSAFSYCWSLTSVTIPDSVTSIGNYAFFNCSSLTSVTIPDSVTSIGNYAFYDCTSLASVTIPDSVTSIGNSAFFNCSSLTSVTIPDSVTSIGNYAFYDCTSLASVYCKPTTPPTAITNSWGDWDAFYNNASSRKIYVPTASVASYKVASYWSNYAEDIEGYDF